MTAGVTLLLERSLTRILLGVVLLGNGVNLLILSAGGAAGGPPLLSLTPEGEMADPLPQAMILTAIIITLGVTAFLLAMAYRSWLLQGNDEVQDDAEDRRIATGGERRRLRQYIRAQNGRCARRSAPSGWNWKRRSKRRTNWKKPSGRSSANRSPRPAAT